MKKCDVWITQGIYTYIYSPTSEMLAKYYVVLDGSLVPMSNGLPDDLVFFQVCAFSKALRFPVPQGAHSHKSLNHFIIKVELLYACDVHVAHVHAWWLSMQIHQENEIKSWRKFWKLLLEGLYYLIFSWCLWNEGSRCCMTRPLSLWLLNTNFQEIKCVRSTKRIYLIIVLIYNLDGARKRD